MRRSVLIVLTAVVIAGCGGSASASRDSGIEGVPIPRDAEEMNGGPGMRTFRVPGKSFEELADWYDRAMPARRGFRDWSLCAAGEEDSFWERINYRVYERGSAEALLVAIVDDYEYDDRVYLMISTDYDAYRGWAVFC